MEPFDLPSPIVSSNSYVFVHTTDEGYACLEDAKGNEVRIPLAWLP